jgi:hypothetical protein
MEKRQTRIQLDTCGCNFDMEFMFNETEYVESIIRVNYVCDKHLKDDIFESARIALLENRLKNVPDWVDPLESDENIES